MMVRSLGKLGPLCRQQRFVTRAADFRVLRLEGDRPGPSRSNAITIAAAAVIVIGPDQL